MKDFIDLLKVIVLIPFVMLAIPVVVAILIVGDLYGTEPL